MLLREGAEGSGLHVVLSGAVKVTLRSVNGDVDIAELGPGDVFGEISLLEGVPVTATVTASAAGVVLVLAGGVFRRLVDGVPGWRRYFEELADERRMDLRLSVPPAAAGWY